MFFEQKINTRSRQAMVEFLSGHFRYPTGKSWGSTNYANRAKLYHVGLKREQENRAYDLLDTDYHEELHFLIDDFTSKMDGRYTHRI